MKRLNIIAHLLFISNLHTIESCGQKSNDSLVFINPNVINKDSSVVNEVITVWGKYLATKDSLYGLNHYWSNEEKKRRNQPDYFIRIANNSGFYKKKSYYKPTVLAIIKNDTTYTIKTLFANAERDNGFSRVSAIVNVEVVKEGASWRLRSMLERNLKEEYLSKKIGNILYYYPKSRKLNKKLAKKFDKFNDQIATKFGNLPIKIIYYLCRSNRDVKKLKGFDFEPTMFYDNQIGGMADLANNAIYAGNDSEIYEHELIHLYADKKWPNNSHELFTEGLATYLGGSVGYPLDYHVKKIALYAQTHKVDFSDLANLPPIDEYTNFQYTIGGLICKIVDKKSGLAGLTVLSASVESDEAFYRLAEQSLNITPYSLTEFIQHELEKYK